MSIPALLNDPLYGNRQDTHIIELLDLNNEVIEQLFWSDGNRIGVLPGGSLELSNATDTRESARLTMVRDYREPTPWWDYHVRISYVGAGFTDPQPLSTLMPTASPETYPNTHAVDSLELHSMLAVLLRSTMGTTFGIEQGQVVTDWIGQIIETGGLSNFSIVPSSRVLASSIVWSPNTSRLRIVNDLLAIIGYWSAHTDPLGSVIIEPHVPLDARPLIFTFDDQPLTGLYMPDWSRDRDLLVPNRVIVVQRVEGDVLPLTVTAELPPEHPQSAANRGYYDDRVETDIDFADYESGYLRALALLGDGLPTEARVFKHLWVPDVVPNAKIVHKREGLPDLLAPVQRQTHTLAVGGMVETRISGSTV